MFVNFSSNTFLNEHGQVWLCCHPMDVVTQAGAGAGARRPIRLAGPSDADAVGALIAEAFHPLALSAWLVGDPGRRSHVLHEVFRIHVEHAVASGWVWIEGDADGVAVWQPGGL